MKSPGNPFIILGVAFIIIVSGVALFYSPVQTKEEKDFFDACYQVKSHCECKELYRSIHMKCEDK